MKNISLVVICSVAIAMPMMADARGGRGGGSRSYSKGYSSGYSSASRARGCYGCYDNSYSSSPSTSTYTPSNLSTTTYVIPEVAKYYATTIRKAGVRTCAKHYCTVVKYLPKGTRVTWANSSEGFINMTNSPYWIKSTDLK
jgi:hypothetical protein